MTTNPTIPAAELNNGIQQSAAENEDAVELELIQLLLNFTDPGNVSKSQLQLELEFQQQISGRIWDL